MEIEYGISREIIKDLLVYIDHINVSERNKEIVKEYVEGASYTALGRIYGISASRIRSIIVNYRHHAVRYGKGIGELRVIYQ